jgi:hypothetical protein
VLLIIATLHFTLVFARDGVDGDADRLARFDLLISISDTQVDIQAGQVVQAEGFLLAVTGLPPAGWRR